MSKDIVRIANGAGFWGDNLDAPRLLVENAAIDYLTLEYLAELTMSLLARARRKNPDAGYAGDIVEVTRSLLPSLTRKPDWKVITNAGGMNPPACAKAIARILADAGLQETVIAAVSGDDIVARLPELQAAGIPFINLDTGKPLQELSSPIESANVYLGAPGIVEALQGNARIVITGRVADASLTLGPAMYEFGWKQDAWDLLAGGSVAGHLIECGAQVTGGLFRHWEEARLSDVGYPIAELSADGSLLITKPKNSGGLVTRETVSEQLVYEIGDPKRYLTPDVTVDFTTVRLEEVGPDRVRVRGASGTPAPDTLKVSLAYRDGFMTGSQLLVYGEDCLAKAKACAEMILHRVRRAGFKIADANVEYLGAGSSVPGVHQPPADLREVMLRITLRDPREEALERFTKEIAPLITSGPAGLAGYAAGRSPVRPVYSYWPTLIPRELVSPQVTLATAQGWLND